MEEPHLHARKGPAPIAPEPSPTQASSRAARASTDPARGPWRSKAAVAAGVVLLTAAALALRLHGIGFMLPHVLEPDGGVIMRQVILMHSAVATPELESNWSAYPHLVARFIALFPDAEKWRLASNDLAGHLRAASAPLLQARLGVAVLSVLLVPGTWLLARRFFSRGAAFFAAAWMSTSLLAVWFSQECRPHGPAAAMSLLAVLTALRLRERPNLPAYVWAGIAAGLAIGTLQSGMAVMFPLLAAHWMRRTETPGRARWLLLVSLALAVGVAALFYPFLFKPTDASNAPAFAYTGETFEFFGHSIFLGMFNGSGFRTELQILWSFQLVASLMALVGVIAWLLDGERKWARAYWREHPDLCVVLWYVVPYFVVVGMYQRVFERFVLQLTPFLFVLGVYGALRSAAWLRARRVSDVTIAAGALVLFAVPAVGTLRLVHLRAAPDTGTIVAHWIEENVKPDDERVLVVPFLDFPVWHTERSLVQEADLGWTSPWQRYQAKLVGQHVDGPRYDLRFWPFTKKAFRELALKDPLRFAREANAKYVVINLPFSPTGDTLRPPFLAALRTGAELVLREPSDARGVDGEPVLQFEDMPDRRPWNWTMSLLSDFSATGPVTEIYRIR